jgi:hypothetical protein
MSSPIPAIALVVLLVVGGVLVAVAGEPVSRTRVDRFARRERLVITPGNGNHVIRYLATTRRWRIAGLGAGIAASVLHYLPNEVRLDASIIFAGWFAGALMAEVRVDHLRHGARRAALVRARRANDYVGRATWALGPVSAVVAVLAAGATLAGAATGRADPDGSAVAWLPIAIGIAVAVRLVQRRVLRRPQPLAPDDVIAADNAIRSRALHVLSAGGAALVLLCVSAQVAAASPVGVSAVDLSALRGAFAVLVGVVGWLWATGSLRAPGVPAGGPTAQPDALR